MNKKVYLTISDEDVIKYLLSGIQCAVGRNETKRKDLFKDLAVGIKNESKREISGILGDLVNTDIAFREDLENLLPLLEALENDLVSPDTQIIKDLPDLKEDSLGVDGGSE